MSKITKKQYQERKEKILNQIQMQRDIQKSIELQFDQDNYINGDNWNRAEDIINDLQRELKFLDDEWEKRNWNSQDHYMHSLAINNID